MTRDLERLARPCGIKLGCERVFVLKTSQTLGRGRFCGRSNRQKGHWIAALPTAVKREVRSFADWLQDVMRKTRSPQDITSGIAKLTGGRHHKSTRIKPA